MTNTPKVYFWLMFQILIIWVSFAVTVCHFFRKYCQNEEPDIEMGEEPEEEFLGYEPEKVHDF